MGQKVAALFAGIGGIELGLHRAGHESVFFCESWAPAKAVLEQRFDADVHPNVATVRSLPSSADTVTAGFPCTDLSQAGRTAGIGGSQSGLVSHVLRLLDRRMRSRFPLDWVVIENVQNMLALDRGEAMRFLTTELEDLGLRWAYRLVDSRFTGTPQRRRRVLLLASPVNDPRSVLFADDAGERPDSDYRHDGFGFYWTEGLRGLGWAVDAVPTLKGGSTVGIPSPPAIWVREGEAAAPFVTPDVEDAEALQGFPRGWTRSVDEGRRNGPRWKLVGNAVTVGVSEWLGRRLAEPGDFVVEDDLWEGPGSWPAAAWGEAGKVRRVHISEYPEHHPYRHLLDEVDLLRARPLTHRGVSGFWNRLSRGNLGQYPGFRGAVERYLLHMEADLTTRLK